MSKHACSESHAHTRHAPMGVDSRRVVLGREEGKWASRRVLQEMAALRRSSRMALLFSDSAGSPFLE